MANFTGFSRTNYFAVKDFDAFSDWATARDLTVLKTSPHSKGGKPLYGFLCEEGSWPSSYYDEDAGEDVDTDIIEEVASHLASGAVAILMTGGSEGHRYIAGQSVAVHSDGRKISIDLSDIYKMAQDAFGIEPTRAEY